jgi:dimethylaniline monooxygenase (N-oxide forming)
MAELQARYFAQLCSNSKRLPTREHRREIARVEAEHWQEEYHITPHVSSLVNYCTYTDAMAELVGCKPKAPFLLFDPELYLKLWFGPQFSAQFRLRGPHANAAASERFIRTFPLTVSRSRIVVLMLCKLLTQLFFGLGKFKPRKLGAVEPRVTQAELPAVASARSAG